MNTPDTDTDTDTETGIDAEATADAKAKTSAGADVGANANGNANRKAEARAEGQNERERRTERPLRFVSRHRAGGGPPHAASHDDDDPLAGIANLFDVSVAFIVALLIALFSLFSAGSMLDPSSNVTLVKQADNGSLEIITKKGAEISVQKVTDRSLSGQGTRLGTAYQLANGQVVYVPEGEGPPK